MKSKNTNQLGKLTICEECGWFGYKVEFENNKCPNCFQSIDENQEQE